jgi:hypothetical protein
MLISASVGGSIAIQSAPCLPQPAARLLQHHQHADSDRVEGYFGVTSPGAIWRARGTGICFDSFGIEVRG